MRSMYPGYYPPSADELDSLWNEGVVVIDTNGLLNLFRYTASTRDTFIAILRQMRDRLWLPHQVGLEFHKRRRSVINEQADVFNQLESKVQTALHAIDREIGALRHHPSLDLDSLKQKVKTATDSIATEIQSEREAYELANHTDQHENTTSEITELFEGKVGNPYETSKLEEIYKLGESRYSDKTPPGYKDSAKPSPDRFGDLILWFQILDMAQTRELPVLFITDDSKEDWWLESKGKTIGPRVELVDEFHERVGRRVHFYSPQQFMRYASERGYSVESSTIDEVGVVSEAWASSTGSERKAGARRPHPVEWASQSGSSVPPELWLSPEEQKLILRKRLELAHRLEDYLERNPSESPFELDTTAGALLHEIGKLDRKLSAFKRSRTISQPGLFSEKTEADLFSTVNPAEPPDWSYVDSPDWSYPANEAGEDSGHRISPNHFSDVWRGHIDETQPSSSPWM